MRCPAFAAVAAVVAAGPLAAQTCPPPVIPPPVYGPTTSPAGPGPAAYPMTSAVGPVGSPPLPTGLDGVPTNVAEAASAFPVANYWLHTDYLLWFVRNSGSPTLIGSVPSFAATTTGSLPPDAVNREFPTRRDLYFGPMSGLRLTAGYQCTPELAAEVSGFLLESKSLRGAAYADGAAGSPGLVQPYRRATDGTFQNLFANFPGNYAGGITAFADSQVWSYEANLKLDWYRLYCDRLELIAGIRNVGLVESVQVDAASFGGTLGNAQFSNQDVFRTRNVFTGFQSGFMARWYSGSTFSLDSTFKSFIGNTYQRVEIFGANVISTPAGVSRENIGLYAGPFNSGVRERNKFSVGGEFGLNGGVHLTPHVRLQIGYNITWLSSVIRAGEAINPDVNDANLRYVAGRPPANASTLPTFSFAGRASDFWVQGINFGFTIGY